MCVQFIPTLRLYTMAEKSNKMLLLEVWKECGSVEYKETFKKISDTESENLKHTIKKMKGCSTDTHDSIDLCIADEHYKMHNKAPTPTAKKLLLSSGQNAVVESIKHYLHLHYSLQIMRVRNYERLFPK